MKEVRINFDDSRSFAALCGQCNETVRLLERRLGLTIAVRGEEICLQGEEFSMALGKQVLEELYALVKRGDPLYPEDVESAITILSGNRGTRLSEIFGDRIHVTASGRQIRPKGLNQKRYVDAIRRDDIVFGIGPAGTGKTYLAMAMAIGALSRKEVKRILLTRPAVEAGERLGFLPGDIVAKVNPYLRPLYDALYDMMETERAERLLEKSVIEVAPLAFMRGRTLNDAFVIFDEAQNATVEQMKMFLTRLGFNSKAVVTGDVTQVDLPRSQPSGLNHARRILANVDGISICRFQKEDVVRHPLVQKVIEAYEQDAANNQAPSLARQEQARDDDGTQAN